MESIILHRGYIGIMQRKIDIILLHRGFYRDNGKDNAD